MINLIVKMRIDEHAKKANREKTKLYDKIQKEDKTKLSDSKITDKDDNTN